MDKKNQTDEFILLELLKRYRSEDVRQQVFRHYKNPFIRFFEHNEILTIKETRILYNTAFATMIQGIKSQPVETLYHKPLFNLLLDCALQLKGIPLDKRSRTARKVHPYLAGEVLIQLIQLDHKDCFRAIFKHYKEPTLAILKNNYEAYFTTPPIEIYGDALMVLKSNILEGKVTPPLKSRLFTYFFNIARNKYLTMGNRLKGLTFYQSLEGLECNRSFQKNDNTYLDYVLLSWPGLSLHFDDKEDVFVELLATFSGKDRSILNMRFNEGLRFKEISNRLNIKEATCRKRLHDCLKRWKYNFFNERHVALSE